MVDDPGQRPPNKRPAKRKVKAKARPAPMAGGPPPPRRRPRSAWDSRAVAAAVLAGSILIAAVIALIGLDDDDGGDQSLLPTTTEENTPTTEDLEVPFPTAPTSTAAPGGTATTAPGPATTGRSSPTTVRTNTTTGTGGGPACGSGSVRAEPRGGQASDSGAGWDIGGEAFSNFSEPVEVTRLVVRVTFEDGSTRDVEIPTSGPAIEPGGSRRFEDATVASDSRPVALEVVALSYQPAGRPDCAISG